ncbi:TlpA disulfide reductase family protein [Pedobacter sp. PLR]|uniref:TlpA family protein disulfide reductase n=1 Tax=Pedobacter sp. PLR TaxID=2994465 RepID=UPI002247077C|nr:TlpA disulfide reductase family protein [Pedobacter sp. PLR]MCX2449942.1 TlpA disulfide reductase family protein [Pedobacter sp. PLR]
MKNINKIAGLILLFLCVITESLIAQAKMGSMADQITIEIDLLDNADQPLLNKELSVRLSIATFGSDISIAPRKVYTTILSTDKPFKISLPSTTNFTYVHFEFEGMEKRGFLNNYYIFEKGDSVKCRVSGNSYEFYGKGAEKLNCQSEMYDLQYRSGVKESKLYRDKQYETLFRVTKKILDSIFELQVEIVNKHAIKLGRKMTEIMLANAYGNRYAPNISSVIMSSRINDRNLLPAFLKSDAYRSIDMSLNQKLDPTILISSTTYCNFLLEKITAENSIDPKSLTLRSKIEMPTFVFNAIKNNHRGLLREKLLAMFFLRYKDYSISYPYLDEAISYVENTEIKDILLNIKDTRTKGVAFFPFELEDTNGTTIRLSDFSGKVVVLDFWYTGCTNCIILHEGMKPIVEKFKNNPKVEFVSVSVDKDKLAWLKSVASGKYTDPQSLNLYTSGLGTSHSLIEKYNIRSYPTQFVLKNGTVFSSSPPRLGPAFTNNIEARSAFISLIEEALRDNYFLP